MAHYGHADDVLNPLHAKNKAEAIRWKAVLEAPFPKLIINGYAPAASISRDIYSHLYDELDESDDAVSHLTWRIEMGGYKHDTPVPGVIYTYNTY